MITAWTVNSERLTGDEKSLRNPALWSSALYGLTPFTVYSLPFTMALQPSGGLLHP
jgi:hypothetical protein